MNAVYTHNASKTDTASRDQRLKMLGLAALCLALVGCGKFQSQSLQTKTFSDQAKKIDFTVILEKPKFIESQEATIKKAKADSNTRLANTIRNVRLDTAVDEPSKIAARVTFFAQGSADFRIEVGSKKDGRYPLAATSASGLHKLEGSCVEAYCDHASLVLTEISSNAIVQIEYSRSTEYLKPEDLGRIQVTGADRDLLSDVIEYHLPITRHAAKIAGKTKGGNVTDLLIVTRPEVDAGDEDLDGDESGDSATNAGAPGAEPAATATPASVAAENHVLELESSSEEFDEEPSSPADTQTTTSSGKKPDTKTETKPAAPKSTDLKDQQLVLTSNPYDVYNVTIPKERLRNMTVNDPLKFASFEIIPAERQSRFEPSFRIAVLAEAFVEQNVRVYRNACNIFVRAVMTLAGYTKGGSYRANDFGKLFETRGQGLDQWKKSSFDRNGAPTAGAANVITLQSTLNALPEAHGTVVQVIRTGGRAGHVGIVARLDGDVFMIDGNLDKIARGLRKAKVGGKELLNQGSRRNLQLYGPAGVLKTGQFARPQ